MPTLKSKQLAFKKIAITTGDPNGVGFEVSAKALTQIKPRKNVIYFLFRDHKQELAQKKYFKLMDSNWTRLTFDSLAAALNFVDQGGRVNGLPKNLLVDLSLKSTAADWVVESAKACLNKQLDSIVTAPLSKTLIKKAGYKEIGHTGLFKTLCPKANLHMAFVGKDFHVILATDHIEFTNIEKTLTRQNLKLAFMAAEKLKQLVNSKKPIAVLGLNPHSGEKGLLGSFESRLLNVLPKGFEGPLIPDAAFLKKNWSKYSVYLCMYHDQGLIPFKMHHGQDAGVHVTMGLPFVRTSVDHGTAFDIFNKNLANPNSMLDAIALNLKLLGV